MGRSTTNIIREVFCRHKQFISLRGISVAITFAKLCNVQKSWMNINLGISHQMMHKILIVVYMEKKWISKVFFSEGSKTSKYAGVTWNNNIKKWQVQLVHNKKKCYGGYFDNEEHAAMKVNLLCDKYESERKNPMINIDLDVIQKVIHSLSIIYENLEQNLFALD